jgi:hypothetical protein|tara:strand:- start:108 stop:515 length:408 start_codon:yes stop_codon:yes gene_type:complete
MVCNIIYQAQNSCINICMSIYTQNLNITQGPWRIQDPHRGTVFDLEDRLIATVPKAGAVPFEQRQANLHAISELPAVVAALREAAFALHTLGYPLKPEYYELMNRATPGGAPIALPEYENIRLGDVVVLAPDGDA